MGESATGNMLVLSQVILSMQLGFAVIPLLHYVSDKKRMGEFAIGFWTKLAGWLSAVVIVSLNVWLVVTQVQNWLQNSGEYTWIIQFIVLPVLLFAAFMLVYIVVRPLLERLPIEKVTMPHGVFKGIEGLKDFQYKKIAVALDFSEADKKTLEHALHLGGKTAKYFLIHVVETAGALVMGSDIRDYESTSDAQNMELYASQLREMGYECEVVIGYGPAKRAIPTLVNEKGSDLVVMGAHGHKALKDFLLGTTVGAVRHAVKIPVLIVR